MPAPFPSRISTVLDDLPGAEALYLFGSVADPQRRDSSSDLDLRVITADFARSRPAWPWIR
jgi:predicted nucleotidyltransferase